jgi:hypothetical protein
MSFDPQYLATALLAGGMLAFSSDKVIATMCFCTVGSVWMITTHRWC